MGTAALSPRPLWILLLLTLAFSGVVLTLLAKPDLFEQYVVADQPLEQADAMVLMAGERFFRLPAVVSLFQKDVAPRILLTNDGVLGGWSDKYHRNLYQVEWAKEFLVDRGIPDTAIELLNFSKSGSYYDALNTRKFVLSDGSIRSLVIVTSDYHTRRSVWTFEKVFSPSDIQIGVYTIPDSADIAVSRRLLIVFTEIIKFAFYKVRYAL
jgi:uncharacterized SAM-binding protein YcdF (DUF218 family)